MHADVGGEAQQESAIIKKRSPISVSGITGTSFHVAFLKPCERRMVWGRVLICASFVVFHMGMNIFLFKGLVDVGQFDCDMIPSWQKREKVVPFWLYMWLYTVCHLKIESHIMQAAMSSVDVSVLLVGLSQTLPAAHCWLVGSLPNISELDPPKLILCWHVNKGLFSHLKDIHFLWGFGVDFLSRLQIFNGRERFDLSTCGPNVFFSVLPSLEKMRLLSVRKSRELLEKCANLEKRKKSSWLQSHFLHFKASYFMKKLVVVLWIISCIYFFQMIILLFR